MSLAWFCDECEARLEGAALDCLGSPALVTDGDHYWCPDCWRGRTERIQQETCCDVIGCDSVATIDDIYGRHVCAYHGDA